MFFNDYENRNIVRIFPLEDYKKMDKLDKLQLGVIYIGNDEKSLIDNKLYQRKLIVEHLYLIKKKRKMIMLVKNNDSCLS